MFKREPKIITVGGRDIKLEAKPKTFGGLFKRDRRVGAITSGPSEPGEGGQSNVSQSEQAQRYTPPRSATTVKTERPLGKSGFVESYIKKLGTKHKGLEEALGEQNIKGTMREFLRRMFFSALMVAVIIAVSIGLIFFKAGQSIPLSIILGAVMGYVVYRIALNSFLNYPINKSKKGEKGVERDILFAARDLIISLRSGMPLFNAIASVCTGYGDASKEFRKVIERAQLGMPLESSLDAALDDSKSPSFKRLMIQASVSVKAGADVVAALQTVLDDLSQERLIELRRYGQRLNAIAMFYMLFGVILPSMGLAVATILTTFISLFRVTPQLLYIAVIAIFFLQIVFLKLITSSRPVFAM